MSLPKNVMSRGASSRSIIREHELTSSTVVSPIPIPHAPEVASGMNLFCVENIPNSRHTQLQEEGKEGCLFAGRNHLAHSRQFQRRKEKSRLAENVARFTEVHSNPSFRNDKKAWLVGRRIRNGRSSAAINH